ncbi:MAG: hypothetical protein EU541_03140 [Promethearchaeota archaeon]|nr:MAG: hypothetical protein EU541_03140 [Candidatus Lokiarchaeota archaeon]
MSLLTPLDEKDLKISRFLDLDKDKSRFYNNIYLENLDLVIKIPFTEKPSESPHRIKIEKFDLTKYIYLVDY